MNLIAILVLIVFIEAAIIADMMRTEARAKANQPQHPSATREIDRRLAVDREDWDLN